MHWKEKENKTIIDAVSISQNNVKRVVEVFNGLDCVQNQEKGFFYNYLQFPGQEPIKTRGEIDFWGFVDILKGQDYHLIKDYVRSNEDRRVRIGRGNIDNLEDERISNFQGVLVTPTGFYNTRPIPVTKKHPTRQLIEKIDPENFHVLPVARVHLK